MTVTALIPVGNLNLVVPLAGKATAMRTTETTGHCPEGPAQWTW